MHIASAGVSDYELRRKDRIDNFSIVHKFQQISDKSFGADLPILLDRCKRRIIVLGQPYIVITRNSYIIRYFISPALKFIDCSKRRDIGI